MKAQTKETEWLRVFEDSLSGAGLACGDEPSDPVVAYHARQTLLAHNMLIGPHFTHVPDGFVQNDLITLWGEACTVPLEAMTFMQTGLYECYLLNLEMLQQELPIEGIEFVLKQYLGLGLATFQLAAAFPMRRFHRPIAQTDSCVAWLSYWRTGKALWEGEFGQHEGGLLQRIQVIPTVSGLPRKDLPLLVYHLPIHYVKGEVKEV